MGDDLSGQATKKISVEKPTESVSAVFLETLSDAAMRSPVSKRGSDQLERPKIVTLVTVINLNL